jgi:hypothetical protein
MASWSHASQGIVDAAMESFVAPRVPSSIDLRDKVFHLKTQIESIEDAPGRPSEPSDEARLVTESDAGPQDVAQQTRAAEMQMWWDEAIVRNMDLPDGYAKVAVLLVKWDDELDELRTRAEVRVGPSLFRNASDQYRLKNSTPSSASVSTSSPKQSSSMSRPSRNNKCAPT